MDRCYSRARGSLSPVDGLAAFFPLPGATTDFRPETPAERALITEMATESVAAGFYVFGAAIVAAPPDTHDFRALKGPAINHAGYGTRSSTGLEDRLSGRAGGDAGLRARRPRRR
jgi:hypothetical protein